MEPLIKDRIAITINDDYEAIVPQGMCVLDFIGHDQVDYSEDDLVENRPFLIPKVQLTFS
jgi:hypothetical protein